MNRQYVAILHREIRIQIAAHVEVVAICLQFLEHTAGIIVFPYVVRHAAARQLNARIKIGRVRNRPIGVVRSIVRRRLEIEARILVILFRRPISKNLASLVFRAVINDRSQFLNGIAFFIFFRNVPSHFQTNVFARNDRVQRFIHEIAVQHVNVAFLNRANALHIIFRNGAGLVVLNQRYARATDFRRFAATNTRNRACRLCLVVRRPVGSGRIVNRASKIQAAVRSRAMVRCIRANLAAVRIRRFPFSRSGDGFVCCIVCDRAACYACADKHHGQCKSQQMFRLLFHLFPSKMILLLKSFTAQSLFCKSIPPPILSLYTHTIRLSILIFEIIKQKMKKLS